MTFNDPRETCDIDLSHIALGHDNCSLINVKHGTKEKKNWFKLKYYVTEHILNL